MANKFFDPTKPVQTRDGRKARIICTDLKQYQGPVVAAVVSSAHEIVIYCGSDGRSSSGVSRFDLVNVPQNRFTNLYDSKLFPYRTVETLKEARIRASRDDSYKWKGTIEETEDGEFVTFHPRPKEG